MAHKRKGQLTVTREWAKHLRKDFRRQFWKGERRAAKNIIRKSLLKRVRTATRENTRAAIAIQIPSAMRKYADIYLY